MTVYYKIEDDEIWIIGEHFMWTEFESITFTCLLFTDWHNWVLLGEL